MPRTGIPASSRPSGMGGAPSAYTDEGPPDRMIALGSRASICAAGMLAGTISECTWHSLTRRAMSCAYWAPKSTTRTVSWSGTGCTMPPSPHAADPCRSTRPGGPGARNQSMKHALRRRRGAPGLVGDSGHGGIAGAWDGGADPHPGDAAGVHLGHGQPVPVHLDSVPDDRQLPERREYVTRHGLVRALREGHPGLLGELVQVQ